MASLSEISQAELQAAFRTHYYHFVQSIDEAAARPADSTVLARLGDSLDEYLGLLNQVRDPVNTSHYNH